MKKILLFVFLICAALAVQAQDIREIIAENPNMSGGIYTSYPDGQKAVTPAPEDYEPFYISHYGRHGSRRPACRFLRMYIHIIIGRIFGITA